jgi:hypothetical protein
LLPKYIKWISRGVRTTRSTLAKNSADLYNGRVCNMYIIACVCEVDGIKNVPRNCKHPENMFLCTRVSSEWDGATLLNSSKWNWRYSPVSFSYFGLKIMILLNAALQEKEGGYSFIMFQSGA